MKRLAMVLLVFSLKLSASVGVGDKFPNLCWTDVDQKKVCVDDFKGQVRLLFYTTGWCDFDKSFTKDIVTANPEYQDKPVTFLNLPFQGWSHSSPSDQKFLEEWRLAYQIPFTVAHAERDEIRNLFGYVQSTVVALIDKNGVLRYQPHNGFNSEIVLAMVDRSLNK